MKIFISLLILSLSLEDSLTLHCNECEVKSSGEFSCSVRECPEETSYCEAFVSKIEGNYSVIMSCATIEKCGLFSSQQGLEECDHLSSNTECYHCCDGNECNSLSEVMNKLPTDMFTYKNESTDYDSELSSDKKILEALKKIISEGKKVSKQNKSQNGQRREEEMNDTMKKENSSIIAAVNLTKAEAMKVTEAVDVTSTIVQNDNSTTIATVKDDDSTEMINSTDTSTTLEPETTLTSSINTTESTETDLTLEDMPELPVDENALVDPSLSVSSKLEQDFPLILFSIVVAILFFIN